MKHVAKLLIALALFLLSAPAFAVCTATNSLDATPMIAQERVVGCLKGANANITTDQKIAFAPSAGGSVLITNIYVTNASISMTTAAGGLYTAVSKGGIAVVAAGQVYSSLTSPTKGLLLTLADFSPNTVQALWLSLTTGQGSAGTFDIYIIGIPLP